MFSAICCFCLKANLPLGKIDKNTHNISGKCNNAAECAYAARLKGKSERKEDGNYKQNQCKKVSSGEKQ